ATPAILGEYAARFDFIRIVRRKDRGRRSVGPGVVDAFYAGLETIDLTHFDYLCKLDLDLELPKRYFELLMQRMEAEPRLGTCSGKPYYPMSDGRLMSEDCGDETSVGMTKFYRVECFRQVGGFVREVMWDGIDCHRCRMLGWIARSWDDPELRFVHLRPMGSSENGIPESGLSRRPPAEHGRLRKCWGKTGGASAAEHRGVNQARARSGCPLARGSAPLFRSCVERAAENPWQSVFGISPKLRPSFRS